MIFIERYPLKRCQGCVKLIASKVNCFLNINDLSEVQLCMSSNSWTWECPHTKDGADHVPLIFLSSVFIVPLLLWRNHGGSGVQPPPLMGLPIIFFYLKKIQTNFNITPTPTFRHGFTGVTTPTPNGAPYYIFLFKKKRKQISISPPTPTFRHFYGTGFPPLRKKSIRFLVSARVAFWNSAELCFKRLFSH